jgi:hypothetical protein
MKKRLALIVTLLVLVLCATALQGEVPSGVTPENFQRIRTGMTVEQVSALFYVSGKMHRCSEMKCPWSWEENGNSITVHFDQESGRAVEAFFLRPDGRQAKVLN